MKNKLSPLDVFGTDGVRGRANVYPLTAEFVLKLGLAAGHRFLKSGSDPHQIVIGKDTRLSCYLFEAALVAGICSQGVNAVLVGSLPTPAVAFMTRTLRANAGVVISASHNPYHDNGIKFFDGEGYKLTDDTESELEALVEKNNIPLSADSIGKASRIETAVGRYVEFVKGSFDKNLDLRGLKVVVDCANGADYKVAPLTFQELGAETYVINASPNGININEECGSTHPETLSAKVLEAGADVGISFDGDGDRVIMCDSLGNIVDGDSIMAICAFDMKRRGALSRNTVVGTVMSNFGFETALKNQKIKLVRTQVGDRYVMDEVRGGNYNLGGEQSGHIIFTDYTTTGDGLISSLQLLKVMAREGKSLKELSSVIETYPQTLLNIKINRKLPLEELKKTSYMIKAIEAKLGELGRVLVRYSGTENKLRVMVEAPDKKEAEKYAKDIADTAAKELL